MCLLMAPSYKFHITHNQNLLKKFHIHICLWLLECTEHLFTQDWFVKASIFCISDVMRTEKNKEQRFVLMGTFSHGHRRRRAVSFRLCLTQEEED